jgi:hypothetical protein
MNKNDNKIPNILCIFSLACLVLPIIFLIITIILSNYLEGSTDSDAMYAVSQIFIYVLSWATSLIPIGIVLMLIARIRYPKNLFGKIMMWVYIVVVAICVICIIAVIVVCGYSVYVLASCCEELENCGFFGIRLVS